MKTPEHWLVVFCCANSVSRCSYPAFTDFLQVNASWQGHLNSLPRQYLVLHAAKFFYQPNPKIRIELRQKFFSNQAHRSKFFFARQVRKVAHKPSLAIIRFQRCPTDFRLGLNRLSWDWFGKWVLQAVLDSSLCFVLGRCRFRIDFAQICSIHWGFCVLSTMCEYKETQAPFEFKHRITYQFQFLNGIAQALEKGVADITGATIF